MKPYKLSIPVMCSNIDGENKIKTLDALRACGAERVFVAVSAYYTSDETRELVLRDLKDKIDLFKRNGFEVGVWLWSSMVNDECDFPRKVNSQGAEHSTWICHVDEDFLRLAADFAREIAKLSPDLYMMCKSDGEELCVGLWNLSADRIEIPRVELGAKYSSAEYIRCTGDLDGNAVTLSALGAFEFCGIVLKR